MIEPRPERTGFVPRLQSLRGIAAFLVAAFHSAQSRSAEDRSLLTDMHEQNHPVWGPVSEVYAAFCNGSGAVIFFFVLSGFVLSWSVDRGPKSTGRAARRFFIRRILRIFPAAISTVLLFAVVFWISGLRIPNVPPDFYSFEHILRNMLLLEATIDGVMWTLQLELLAAPLILAVVLMQHRWGVTPTVVTTFVLVVLSFSGPWDRLLGAGAALPIGSLYAFSLGILIHQFGPVLAKRLSGRSTGAFFAVMVVMFLAARPIVGRGSRWSALFEATAAAGMIAALVFCTRTDIARPLDARFFAVYGRISFSFYLLHPLTLSVLWTMQDTISALLARGIPSVVIAFGLALLSSAAITPVAWLSWRFVELPGIALGKRLSLGKAAPP